MHIHRTWLIPVTVFALGSSAAAQACSSDEVTIPEGGDTSDGGNGTSNPDGSTAFSMVEVLSGAMLPMIKGSLPDFGPMFETYAADLKREAERTA